MVINYNCVQNKKKIVKIVKRHVVVVPVKHIKFIPLIKYIKQTKRGLKVLQVKIPDESTTSFMLKPLHSKNSEGTIYFYSNVELNNPVESDISKRVDTSKILDWNDPKFKDYRITYFLDWRSLSSSMAIPIRIGGMTRTYSYLDANLIWGYVPNKIELRNFVTIVKNINQI